jgi:hypothetical protein
VLKQKREEELHVLNKQVQRDFPAGQQYIDSTGQPFKLGVQVVRKDEPQQAGDKVGDNNGTTKIQ